MILHCTPPYWRNISNAALGYIKGFLEAEGIPVKNVYWNVVLAKKIEEFQKDLGNYPRVPGSFPSESIIYYVCKQLLTEGSENGSPTTTDQLFSSLYSKEEISETIHAIKEDIDRYIKRNTLHETPVAGFTLKTHQWLMSYYLIGLLKEMNPDTTIVLGGIYNEYQAHTFMRIFNLADCAIWGEGEYPLVHLVRALEEGTTITEVPHLVYRDNTTIVSTHAPLECPPLDTYPFADHSDYFKAMKTVDPFNKSAFVPLLGSRSCNWNKCKFCALNEGYTYRARSPENIVAEMEYQSKKYGVSNFFFTDSDIAGNKNRFIRLCELLMQSIHERRKPYCICGDISPIFIDYDTALYMKRTGFSKVQIGFEAVTDSLLEKMQKKQKVVHNIQALKAADQCSMPLIGLNIIRGIPTETAADVTESCTNLKFLRFFLCKYRLDPTILLLLKGSLFYSEMSEASRKEWNEDLLWKEIVPLGLIPEADRFEFFTFYREECEHYHLWDTFEQLLRFYKEQEYTYEWIETPEGSLIEEKGRKPRTYVLNRDETNLLGFCNSIRKFSEIQKEFSHLSKDEIRDILDTLKESGFLYYDKKGNVISVLEATTKKDTKT
jgi:radical SAM superfamily enzyme YgiQ (UPF0313 family)